MLVLGRIRGSGDVARLRWAANGVNGAAGAARLGKTAVRTRLGQPARPISTIRNIDELRAWKKQQVKADRTVGLVPTMGALHAGHIGLVSQSLEQNDSTVVSIFVNPSQFAPHEDLDQYPRTLDEDMAKLGAAERAAGGNKPVVVFLPSVEQMYPSGITLDISEQRGAFVEVKGLSEQLEGQIRPQFFRGVATIVTKLLNAVQPEQAYFGQKDIQQSVVIKRMVKDLLIPTEIVVGKTAREPNGLAMSSRNEYLTDESRDRAQILYQALRAGQDAYTHEHIKDRATLIQRVQQTLLKSRCEEPKTGSSANFSIDIEYIALSDLESLQEVELVDTPSVISAAIRVPNKSGGQTRIIDNVVLAEN